MAGSAGQISLSTKPRGRSFLRSLAALLVAEHVCAPPDSATAWEFVSEETARNRRAGSTYACPECGQHLARIVVREASAPSTLRQATAR